MVNEYCCDSCWILDDPIDSPDAFHNVLQNWNWVFLKIPEHKIMIKESWSQFLKKGDFFFFLDIICHWPHQCPVRLQIHEECILGVYGITGKLLECILFVNFMQSFLKMRMLILFIFFSVQSWHPSPCFPVMPDIQLNLRMWLIDLCKCINYSLRYRQVKHPQASILFCFVLFLWPHLQHMEVLKFLG